MRLASSGAVAQLVEHLLCKEDVRSSSLLGSTAAGFLDARSPSGFTWPSRVRKLGSPGTGSPRHRGQPEESFSRTPRSGTRMTCSCARPSEWCTLKSEEDKRELRVSSKDETYRSPFINVSVPRSTTGLDPGLLVGQATKGARWMPWR